MNKRPFQIFQVELAVFMVAASVVSCGLIFTTSRLQMANERGIYPSAEAAMRGNIAASYVGIQKVDILFARPDEQNPIFWYVAAQVWADRRQDGTPVGSHGRAYNAPGSYDIHVKEGWVLVKETEQPELIGFWVNLFRLGAD